MEQDFSEVQDADHALLVGMVIGLMSKAGLAVRPTRDSDGDYTPIIELVLPDLGITSLSTVRVHLVVLRQSEDE